MVKDQRHNSKRPEGLNWYGTIATKRTILQAAYRSTRRDGTIDKERFANIMLGWKGGQKGGWEDVRKISLQHGNPSGTESKGRGKGRRPKR